MYNFKESVQLYREKERGKEESLHLKDISSELFPLLWNCTVIRLLRQCHYIVSRMQPRQNVIQIMIVVKMYLRYL